VQAIDPLQPVHNVKTMNRVISESISDRRLYMQVLTAFAALALLLACTGIYGVVSHSTVQRTSEFGLRVALGAGSGNILWLVLREAALLIVAGAAVGVAGALAATRVISQYLYGVQPHDVSTFLVVSLALAGVTLLASYIPARRAAKVDPMVALRCE
jgi:putative ABC transport system permease protein